jgi:DNA-3-methyladenine glycosylase I
MASKFLINDGDTNRCWWCGSDQQYVAYHDSEWGYPVKDDNRLFEKICLEGFQAGLSWLTILRKRENFRAAFAGFDINKVAAFGKRDVNRMLKDSGIVRHRGKIESTINNAKRALEAIEEHKSLSQFFWSYEPARKRKFDAKRAFTDESRQLSKDLKKLGWSFVGPTTCYAFMQAMGMVNDHHPKCANFAKAVRLRKKFKP